MPMYVILGKATEQGAQNVKDMQRLMQESMESGERLGTRLHSWFMTQGRYDFVVVVEAPDDQVMQAQSLSVSSHGNVKTETLRAFTREEAQQIVSRLG